MNHPFPAQVSLRRDAARVSRHVVSDGEWLWEILMNFLTNACKYTAAGHIALTITSVRRFLSTDDLDSCATVAGTTSAAASRTDQDRPSRTWLRIECADSGIGVPLAQRDALFQPFGTLQDRTLHGTGIGLFNVQQKCLALMGRCGMRDRLDGERGSLFWAEVPYTPTSDDDPGTSNYSPTADFRVPSTRVDGPRVVSATDASVSAFAMALPAKSPAAQSSPELLGRCLPTAGLQPPLAAIASKANATANAKHTSDLPPRQPPKQWPGKTALLVDDTGTILSLMVHIFQRKRFNVTTASNGAAALEKLTHDTFDICLMDVQMPTMDGLECTRRLRAVEQGDEAKRPRQLVVGLSANAEPADEYAAREAGMDDFLAKPVHLSTLEELLQRHLEPRHQAPPTSSTANHATLDADDAAAAPDASAPRKKPRLALSPTLPKAD